jgi:hypothetical protein
MRYFLVYNLISAEVKRKALKAVLKSSTHFFLVISGIRAWDLLGKSAGSLIRDEIFSDLHHWWKEMTIIVLIFSLEKFPPHQSKKFEFF